MRRFFKMFSAVCLGAALCVSGLTLTGCGKNDGPDTFTIWIAQGIPSDYYDNYSKNPVAEYIAQKFGITLNFRQPISGEEVTDFNNLINSGDYPDVMDTSYYTAVGSIVDLYDNGQGAAMDITEYVEDYMPNYQAFLAANPHLAKTAKINGKYLNIITYSNAVGEQWGGLCYRRDWIVKHGTKSGGGSFTASGTGDDYTDDVVFPSGNTDPVTIADWEWMLEIFKNISDCKYPMSLPYQGFFEVGDLVSAFGGGAPYWYIDGETVKFGGNSDAFKRYLTKMNEWYSAGYIDTSFDEHASDPFYMIDDTIVRQGKVGLWYGMSSQFGNRLQLSDWPATQGIQVFGCSNPVEDTSVSPKVFYQDSMESSMSYIVTDKAKDKNLEKLFEALDYLYGAEGSLMKTLGLNKDQYEETKNALMKKEGLTDGVIIPTADGKYTQVDKLLSDGGMLQSACIGDKIVGLVDVLNKADPYGPAKSNSLAQWVKYTATGTIPQSLQNQKTDSENATYASNQTKIRDYMAINVPKFIKGELKLNTGNDWANFTSALNTRGASKNTQILQDVYNRV